MWEYNEYRKKVVNWKLKCIDYERNPSKYNKDGLEMERTQLVLEGNRLGIDFNKVSDFTYSPLIEYIKMIQKYNIETRQINAELKNGGLTSKRVRELNERLNFLKADLKKFGKKYGFDFKIIFKYADWFDFDLLPYLFINTEDSLTSEFLDECVCEYDTKHHTPTENGLSYRYFDVRYVGNNKYDDDFSAIKNNDVKGGIIDREFTDKVKMMRKMLILCLDDDLYKNSYLRCRYDKLDNANKGYVKRFLYYSKPVEESSDISPSLKIIIKSLMNKCDFLSFLEDGLSLSVSGTSMRNKLFEKNDGLSRNFIPFRLYLNIPVNDESLEFYRDYMNSCIDLNIDYHFKSFQHVGDGESNEEVKKRVDRSIIYSTFEDLPIKIGILKRLFEKYPNLKVNPPIGYCTKILSEKVGLCHNSNAKLEGKKFEFKGTTNGYFNKCFNAAIALTFEFYGMSEEETMKLYFSNSEFKKEFLSLLRGKFMEQHNLIQGYDLNRECNFALDTWYTEEYLSTMRGKMGCYRR